LRTYHGLPASPGIIIAKAKKYIRANLLDLVPVNCTSTNIPAEVSKINHALMEARKQLENMRSFYAEKELIDALGYIVESIVQEALELVNNEKICSSLAVKRIYEKYAEMLRSTGSQLFAFREVDLRVAAELLLGSILGESGRQLPMELADKVVISEELGITEFFELLKLNIKGLVTRSGGVTSHVAIVARCNGIPYVIVPQLNINDIRDDSRVIIDALNGLVILEPDDSTLKTYEVKAENYWKTLEKIAKYAHEKAVTLDGYSVKVLCNVGNLEEARMAPTLGCDGVGLFRIEFLYMRDKPPTVPELRDVFEKTASFFENKPVVIRAPDIGGDKPVPYISMKEDNPFMGLRGIRLLLEYKEDLFKPFIEAFLEAFKSHNNLKLLLPMVSRVSEVLETVELIEETAKKMNIDTSNLELGVMVEVPSTAILIDKFAETGKIRFVSYGTNDLTQYVLAVDRTNPKVGVIYDDLDPSVLRLLSFSMSKAAENNLEIEVCGELASRQLAIPILLSLGVKGLSVNYSVVGVVKYTVRGISLEEAKKQVLPQVLNSSNSREVREILKDYLSLKKLALLG
jgi:phosphoenolpyruvate-protein phosphotransferase